MALDELKNYMIGVVLFVLVISGGAFMMGIFYNANTSLDAAGEINQFNASLNKAQEIDTSVTGIKESIEAASAEDANVGDYINVLFNTAFNGLQAVGHTMGFVDVAANDAGEILNIPPFVIPLVLLVTIIIIGFAIWAAIMRQ